MKQRVKTLTTVIAASLGAALVGCVGIWAFFQGQETARLRDELAQAIQLLPQGTSAASPIPTESPTPQVETDRMGIPDNPIIAGRVLQPVAQEVSWPQSGAELITTLRIKLAAAANQPYLLADRGSDVRWLDTPREIPLTEDIIRKLLRAAPDDNVKTEYFYSLEQVGEYISGPYAGNQAILLGDEQDMGVSYGFFARDTTTGEGVLLPHYPFASRADYETSSGVQTDNTYRFPDLEYPTTVDLLPGFQLHKIESSWGSERLGPDNDFLVVGQSVIGDLYYGISRHNFFVISKTGSAVTYVYDIPFLSSTARGGYYQVEPYRLNWWYGSSTDEYYSTTPGGCGSLDNRAVDTTVAPSQLVQVGTTGTGDPIYEFADVGAEPLRKLYKEWYVPFEKKKAPYEEFLLAHPIFFWQDELGRLVRFISGSFLSGAECGKPAIYLYPQQTQHVRVEVSPRGGFTYTEPPYGTGWEVMATPDGTLTDIATSKIYPYLWWDGRGGLYAPPEKYWVVGQTDVEPFLRRTLPQLGLNEPESAAFLEYWLPYFTPDHPYYKIGFHGNRAMDELAPLNITPQPDTVIRILMDYEGLSSLQKSNPPHIITPKRQGFTVVEWGGVKH